MSARITKRDLLHAIQCMASIIAATSHDQFVARLLESLQPLMRAKVVGYNEADPVRKRFAFVIRPRHVLSDAMIQAWVTHAHENPLIQHVQRNPGDFSVRKITDFISQSRFRKTALCRTTYRKMRAEYQIAMPFPVVGTAAIAVVFNRSYDFNERERQLLALLQPLVYTAYCNVQKMTDLQLATEQPLSRTQTRFSPRGVLKKNNFTRREIDVLEPLLKGKTNSQIAAELKLARRTIEKYVENLLHKLNVPTRAAACAKYHYCLA